MLVGGLLLLRGSLLASCGDKRSLLVSAFGDSLHWRLSYSHTLHCYSLDDKAKTQNTFDTFGFSEWGGALVRLALGLAL